MKFRDTGGNKRRYMLHRGLHGIESVSLNFTIDNDNIPVIIEVNFIGQGIWLFQIIHGKSAFSCNMEKMLNIIKNRYYQ